MAPTQPASPAPFTPSGLVLVGTGYVLVSGTLALAGKANDLLADPDVGRLFLGG